MSRCCGIFYLRADSQYTGRVTVPILWDKQTETIVNNESREIIQMLSTDFAGLGTDRPTCTPSLCGPRSMRPWTTSTSPSTTGSIAVDSPEIRPPMTRALMELFEALDHWESVLSHQRFMTGETLTLADIALFTTLVRFDAVYYVHFKTNIQRIVDYGLWRFVREVYQRRR